MKDMMKMSYGQALLTLAMLAVGYWLAARYGDLSMRPGPPMIGMPGMVMPKHRM